MERKDWILLVVGLILGLIIGFLITYLFGIQTISDILITDGDIKIIGGNIDIINSSIIHSGTKTSITIEDYGNIINTLG